jgi:hypothetical protein
MIMIQGRLPYEWVMTIVLAVGAVTAGGCGDETSSSDADADADSEDGDRDQDSDVGEDPVGDPDASDEREMDADDADDADAPPSSFPDETSTGIPDSACAGGLREALEADLRPESGSLFECVRFLDEFPYVAQDVSNVTFRYCSFEVSSNTPDAFVNLQGSTVTFEDCEFAGGVETWIRASYYSDFLTIRRCDFSGMANAVEWGTSDVTIEDNYVHDFGTVTDSQHADGIQTDGCSRAVIRHNTVLLNDVAGATGAISIFADLGDVDDVLAESNLVAGGGYTIYPGAQGDFTATNIRFIDNHFSTMFHPDCGSYGPKYPSNLPDDLVWEDNVWHDGPNEGTPVE